MDSKNVLIAFLGGIGILIVLFGLQIYVDLAPVKLLDSDINITEALGNMANERILTVDVGEKNVVFYSFDNGKTFQTENTYSVSENKVVKIVLKDNERRVVGKKVYKVQVVDSTGPVITINNMPESIYVGTSIDFSKYATSHDSNNDNLNVSVNTNSFDNNKVGTYNITYTAVDKNNLKAEVTVEIRVVDKANQVVTKPSTTPTPSETPSTSPAPTATANPTPSTSPKPSEKPKEKVKVTYYRYRTKSTMLYDCNYYACDYLDYNDTQSGNYAFNKDSYCCNGNDCLKTNPKIDVNSICIYNIIPGGACIPRGESFVDKYTTKDNICYDNELLFESDHTNNPHEIAGLSLKTNCSSDEISIDGYCHKIDSYASITCPDGYVNENSICYKNIKRTCNNHCTSETWSKWSEWSTTKVVASDTTEVQTKVETIER